MVPVVKHLVTPSKPAAISAWTRPGCRVAGSLRRCSWRYLVTIDCLSGENAKVWYASLGKLCPRQQHSTSPSVDLARGGWHHRNRHTSAAKKGAGDTDTTRPGPNASSSRNHVQKSATRQAKAQAASTCLYPHHEHQQIASSPSSSSCLPLLPSASLGTSSRKSRVGCPHSSLCGWCGCHHHNPKMASKAGPKTQQEGKEIFQETSPE